MLNYILSVTDFPYIKEASRVTIVAFIMVLAGLLSGMKGKLGTVLHGENKQKHAIHKHFLIS